MLFNLQALRAMAAFLIIFPHLGTVLRPTGWTENDMVFGQFGVDLFFIISGFVMVHTTRRKPSSGTRFLLNRVVRVVPLYWLLTACAFAVALFEPSAMSSTKADPLQLLKSLMFIPFVKSDGLIRPILHVGWTLNYEMYFYGVFALALSATRGNLYKTILVTCFVLAVQTSVRLYIVPTTAVLYFFTDPIMLEFCFGMLLGGIYGKGWLRPPAELAGVLFLLSLMSLLGHRYLLPNGDYRILFAGIPALILVASALRLERFGHKMSNQAIQLLGGTSYSLYLSHPFVAQTIGIVSRRVDSVLMSYLLAAATVAIALGVGILMFEHIERPLTLRIRALLKKQEPMAEAVAVDTA